MQLSPTPIPGCFVLELRRVEDERGFFARIFDADLFNSAGLDSAVAQCSVSYNRLTGTIRGLHFQASPFAETKLVRCTAGAIFDVAVDVLPTSSHFKEWFGIELNAASTQALVVGPGLAHGFCTLTDNAEVAYQISVPHRPSAAMGIRWDDADLAIEWPRGAGTVISERDRHLPSLRDQDLTAFGGVRSSEGKPGVVGH